ncbi:hypothetical protein FQA47_018501 [Oryzias melastigma]|uniref:Uncharacterized protein n=1 Tax=Oryzias melastigma TaxID=30732 RepID=A0A834CNL7_ORYME|nr:hypothetical protein FQA47_018501 [Oryzias melastigma]
MWLRASSETDADVMKYLCSGDTEEGREMEWKPGRDASVLRRCWAWGGMLAGVCLRSTSLCYSTLCHGKVSEETLHAEDMAAKGVDLESAVKFLSGEPGRYQPTVSFFLLQTEHHSQQLPWSYGLHGAWQRPGRNSYCEKNGSAKSTERRPAPKTSWLEEKTPTAPSLPQGANAVLEQGTALSALPQVLISMLFLCLGGPCNEGPSLAQREE